MQLLLPIIAFLLLSQYEVSSGHDHFARELKLFQDSLVEKLYDDTSLNPREDNNEIEDIIDSILDEADRRLKRRKRSQKRHIYHRDGDNYDDNDDEDDKDNNSDEYFNDSKRHQAYRKALASAYSAIVQDYKSRKNDIQSTDNKKQYKKQIKETKTKNTESVTSKREDDSFTIHKQTNTDLDNDEVLVADDGDNVQVASVNVDNSDTKPKGIKNKGLFPEANTSENAQPQKITQSTNKIDKSSLDKVSFIAVIVGCVVAGIAGICLAFFCWYKLRNETKDFNGNGVDRYKSHSLKTSDRKKTSDEEKLARGAEVFHYLHAKKQMQQMEEPNLKADKSAINESSDEEEDENTVYECPGLAPPGDMKVVNPLFSDSESHYSDTQSVQSTPTPPSEEPVKEDTSKSPTEY